VLTFLAAAPGVIVGLLLMIVVRFPVDAANSVSSLVYAVARPFAIAGLTLLYLGWRSLTPTATTPGGYPVPGPLRQERGSDQPE
jgi:protein-S-isoprenylcysteine O-methyltransferase Ste14